MANFNWHIQSLKKGKATPQSDYIWARGQFSSKDDVVATGYGNLPLWCRNDPAAFWQAADIGERANGSACRELVVSLPRELALADLIALVESLIRQDIGQRPYQYAIHFPKRDAGAGAHPHAHILYSDRIPDMHERRPEKFFSRFNPAAPELGGCKKGSGGQTPNQLRLGMFKRKELWADLQNQALAAGGHEARVDPRPTKSPAGGRRPGEPRA